MDVSQPTSHFFAHSENPEGKKHVLKDHLESTAKLARLFAPSRELERLFRGADLPHTQRN